MTEDHEKEVEAAISFIKGSFPSMMKSNVTGFAKALKVAVAELERLRSEPRV